MTLNGWLQILLFFALVLAVTKPLGIFMARVFSRERTWLDPVLRPVERLLYKLTGVNEEREMGWKEYCIAMLLFSAVSMLVLYLIQRLQHGLPWNPQGFADVAPDLAFNTAASFTTNTNWQFYSGENAMSYFTQMAGLAYHNFVSAAVGIALAVAFIRGIARKEKETLGNFWVDMTRAILWILVPFCTIYALFLVQQGVVQNLKPYDTAKLIEPQQVQKVGQEGKPVVGPDGKPVMDTVTDQVIAQGPVASQEAIKMLGTNGGGFFGANSAHPFENPTPFSNFLQIVSIFLIPAGLTYTLGRMTGSRRHGWAVFAAMAVLFFAGVATAYVAEAKGNPLLHGVDQQVSATHSGGNMEGKEVRFGIANSALFATVTTDASCGAVNGQHDSYTPLGGMVPLINIMLGEVVFGGVGAGMYGMLIIVVLSVFIAGLMVGRTPEYLGKKIEAYDVKMAMLYVLIFPLSILIFAALSALSHNFGLATLTNTGPHGLSEILYAFTSATGNNGSAFGGLSANRYYNLTVGYATLIGRFLMIVPMLAVAGNLGRKKAVPPSPGTFPVTTPLFTVLVVSVIIIVGALTFFPALSLGPILEHLLMNAGKTF
ncbi:MAG TPA: potassium-transporting ATPase subunit KdpA [Candidatus Angelobacter sp.]|jgi:K+-transporting ATPase ATPase A chain|nr:potassium-transporting ATPase subunit KdpA [Candidatus Angelobacter sp.]